MIEATAERGFPCPNCGGDLCWTPGQMNFVCASCGTTLRPEATQTTQPKFVERESLPVPAEEHAATEPAAMRCDGCHAVSYFERASAASRCPFCGAATLTPYSAFADFFRPESIVPFLTSESAARDAAAQWVREAWFAPFGLGRLVRTGPIKGAYVPFWSIDTHVVANWDRAQVVRGIIETDVDTLMVSADRDVDPHLFSRIGSFPVKELRAYDPRYTGGWAVSRSRRERDEALRLAHGQIERDLLSMARRGQPAKERGQVQLRGVEYSREVARQTMLPLWTLDYRYLSRRYRIMVNGATAKAAGSAPASIGKVALIAILAFAIGLSVADPQTALRIPALAVMGLRELVAWMFGT